jgi:tetratricopeptide (TPR) repeat protein
MFDRSTITELAAHAENEYAQAAEETGLVGLGLLIIFGIIVWLNFARNIRDSHSAIRLAAYGLGFGLLAILVHSLSDFGQHLPANSVLSAIFCAILLVLARSPEGARQEHTSNTVRGIAALPACIFLMGALVLWAWAIVGADNARRAQARWDMARDVEKGLEDRDWQGSQQEYADLISFAAAASDLEPKNIKYRYWLNVYRWRTTSQTKDPDTGEIVISQDLMPTVLNIVDELHKARAICPTYGPAYSTAGQIEKFVLHNNSGAKRIRKGFDLAPCSPTACFLAGYLDVVEGKQEDCVKKLERAVKLDGSFFRRATDIYANHLSRPNLAISAAGDDIGRLGYVAGVLEDMQYKDLAEQTREKMKDLLETKCSQRNAPASALISLGNIYRKQQDNEAAIKCYRRALTLNYGQVHWRLELARMLAKIERIQEAMQEARTCLQLRPQLKAAEKLIEDLAVHPVLYSEMPSQPST